MKPDGAALDELIARVAMELEDVSSDPLHGESGGTGYRRGSTSFARVAANVLECHLPEDIAEAALRTPDTSAVPREPDWIRFAPASGERHVRDRAEAWFRTAWRYAAR